MRDNVAFLGHEIDVNGIRPSRITEPKTVTEARRFLGLTGYFRKFVKNYAQIAYPTIRLTRKDVPFYCSSECDDASMELIGYISSEPVLGIYDAEKEQELHTDALVLPKLLSPTDPIFC